jgi:tyrosine-protein kinase Etk/Wzc
MSADQISDQSPARRALQADSPTEISLVALVNVLLRRRRVITRFAGGFVLLTLAYLLVAPRTYTVETSFVVDQAQSTAAGLAAQLGVDVGSVNPAQSPAFYAALVTTPDVLQRLADTTFRTGSDSSPRSLYDIWSIASGTVGARRDAVIKKLNGTVSTTVAQKIGLVSIQVSTHDPHLSAGLATALLGAVNRFNLESRQSRARAERQFTDQQLVNARVQLRAVEDTEQTFLEQNRQPVLPPNLAFKRARIERQIEVLQQKYLSLATAYQRARIDEVRDTPVITVIQPAVVPEHADPRRLLQRMILMLFLGAGTGIIVAFVGEAFAHVQVSQDPEMREMTGLMRDSAGQLQRLKHRIARLTSRGQ